jgi:outer membrane protein assembly factor BamE (lipoprotein component of BamABCDE complex)
MLLLASACVNTVTRGHLKEDEAISSIKEGVTTKAEALKALGSPSSESSFGPPTWYYVSSIRQNRSVFAPEVVDQHVIEIAFNANGVVSSLKQYSLKDSKEIQLASRTTPSEGQSLGFFEQILANLGRFNKDTDSSTSNSHTHGNTNPSGYPGR